MGVTVVVHCTSNSQQEVFCIQQHLSLTVGHSTRKSLANHSVLHGGHLSMALHSER